MNNEFKVGDFVYSPREGCGVYEVVRGSNEKYPLRIRGTGSEYTLRGGYLTSDDHPSLFHATKENQAALETLHGVEFENPPLSGRDKVIEALQTSNGKPVICWVKAGKYSNEWVIRAVDEFIENLFHAPTANVIYYYCDAKPLSPDEYVIA